MSETTTEFLAMYHDNDTWDDGTPSRRGWYVSGYHPDGRPWSFATSDLSGWFASKKDCERAIEYLRDNNITEAEMDGMTDEETKQVLYAGLAW